MRLWLTPEQARTITRHALENRPTEICGLIGGIDDQAIQIVQIPNVAAEPSTCFRLDEKVFVTTMFKFERQGLTLVGIYHSHPNGEAIPSQTDIQQAAYPDIPYVIIGLRGKAPRLAAWKINQREITPVELHISQDRPDPQEEPLSQAQKAAIILGIVTAVLFVLILSLSLLPPAPVIVTPLP